MTTITLTKIVLSTQSQKDEYGNTVNVTVHTTETANVHPTDIRVMNPMNDLGVGANTFIATEHESFYVVETVDNIKLKINGA